MPPGPVRSSTRPQTCGTTQIPCMVRLGSDAQFIDSIESKKALRVGSRVGVRLAARRASGAKVLLADLPFEEVALLHPELADDPAGLRV